MKGRGLEGRLGALAPHGLVFWRSDQGTGALSSAPGSLTGFIPLSAHTKLGWGVKVTPERGMGDEEKSHMRPGKQGQTWARARVLATQPGTPDRLVGEQGSLSPAASERF